MSLDVDPRVLRTRQIVLAATIEELIESGFERLTIDAVSERCGVARSTIYRNWADRATLLAEAFSRLSTETPADIAPTGDLRQDLNALARLLVGQLTGDHWDRTVPSLIGAAIHDDPLKELLAGFCAQRRTEAKITLGRALERATIADPELIDGALERFVAPFFFRRLMTRLPLDEAFIAAQVDAALRELTGSR